MRSTEVEYDGITFEVEFEHERDMRGDGYLQPDDPDTFEVYSMSVCGNDLRNHLTDSTVEAIKDLVWEQVK